MCSSDLAGAAGFIPKSMKRSAIVEALHRIVDGEIYVPEIIGEDPAQSREEAEIRARIDSLTPQQRIVLGHLVNGRLNKQIAFDLSISEATVKAHMTAVLRKLDVHNRTQAVLAARALRLDLVH